MRKIFPVFDWGRGYNKSSFSNDAMAALIVTIMLIPQSMAYAMLAGLPPEAGLYGAIVPLLIYAALGTSSALAVGPVAVVALMTAAAAGTLAAQGTAEFHYAALWLALLSGAMMLVMGILRLGFIANFLSHPVISGFITGVSILIAASQMRHLLGNNTSGKTLPEFLPSFFANLGQINLATAAISVFALVFLFWSRKGAEPLLMRAGLAKPQAALLAKGALLVTVASTSLAVWALGLTGYGVRVVGDIPRGLPVPSLPGFDLEFVLALAAPAAMIAIVGYVESMSVSQTLAAKRRQKIDPDKELIALGAANLGAGMINAMPVTGGLSRSIVNFDAGAKTPAAGAMTAVLIGLALLFLTPFLYFLPRAALAAFIIIAVIGLIDLRALPRTWAYSKADGSAMAATIIVTLLMGVEPGLLAGVGLSLVLHLYRTSRPHVAIVGQVPGTEHFRNIDRHAVVTTPEILSIRIDESLYFPNARFLEDTVYSAVTETPAIKHVVLMFPAVNAVDASALESLEAINGRLKDSGVTLHLSEVKGPVMDRLKRSHFLDDLTGEVFLTQYDALRALAPELTARTLAAGRRETQGAV